MDFDTDSAVMEGWMNSPTHKANILKPEYQDVGIAVVEGQLLGKQTILIVAHYGTPIANVAPAVAQAAAPAQPAPQPQAVVQTAASNNLSSKPAPEAVLSAQTPKTNLNTSMLQQTSYSLLAFSLVGAWLPTALYFKSNA
jgi:hypothetical protein